MRLEKKDFSNLPRFTSLGELSHRMFDIENSFNNLQIFSVLQPFPWCQCHATETQSISIESPEISESNKHKLWFLLQSNFNSPSNFPLNSHSRMHWASLEMTRIRCSPPFWQRKATKLHLAVSVEVPHWKRHSCPPNPHHFRWLHEREVVSLLQPTKSN